MAYASTENLTQKKSFWTGMINGLSTFFTTFIEANSRAAQVQYFQSMTDRQLADIGLDRQDIVMRVFANKTGL